MKNRAAIVIAAALSGLAAPAGRAVAQTYDEPADYHFFSPNGPEFAVDHWKSDPVLNMGTNPGIGWRWYNAIGENFHGYASLNTFLHNIPGASLINKAYIEGTVSLLVSPFGLPSKWTPYFGGGGALVTNGGSGHGGSFLLLAGLMRPRKHNTPFFELQWYTRGGRLTATIGFLLQGD